MIEGPTNALANWEIASRRRVPLDRPRILGILNVTPDSFSDGGLFLQPAAAIEQARRMIDEGADVIDVGGESTRPGAASVGAREQIARVIPVVEAIRRVSDIPLSIDTTRAEVARAALDAGADIINDVSAGFEDPAIVELAAEQGCGMILMHRLRPPREDSYSDRYREAPTYVDVVDSVRDHLTARAADVTSRGVEHPRIVIDPGFGFGKTVEQNFEIGARISEIVALGFPVMCGVSRKSFIGRAAGVDDPSARVDGSVAFAVACAIRGARLFRVHDVAIHRVALDIAHRLSPHVALVA